VDPQGHQGRPPAGGEAAPALSVVVPAYNEADRLEQGMARLAAVLDAGIVPRGTTEVLVVDDGSTDGTDRRAHELLRAFAPSRVVRLPHNGGKGAAVRAGMAAARGTRVAFMDADMSIDPEQLGSLVAALDHAAVAIGSRALGGESIDYGNLTRNLMGRAFNRLVNTVTGVGLADTQCGFKAFAAPAGKLLFHLGVIDGFAFDVELLHLAQRLGLVVAEVPVTWQHVADSSVRPLSDPLSMLADLVASRTGLRSPRPVEAVELEAAAGRAERLVELVGPTLPLLEGPDTVTVLFPLCVPTRVAQLAELVAGAGLGPVRRTALTVAQLAERAPLGLQVTGAAPVRPPVPAADGGAGATGARAEHPQ